MVKGRYPAVCNKCGKSIDQVIRMDEDETFVCDSCKDKQE